MHSNTFGVQNGKPYIHSEAYDHITEDQKEKIMELAQAYTYNRTLKTYLSDGAMENSGSKVLSIYIRTLWWGPFMYRRQGGSP